MRRTLDPKLAALCLGVSLAPAAGLRLHASPHRATVHMSEPMDDAPTRPSSSPEKIARLMSEGEAVVARRATIAALYGAKVAEASFSGGAATPPAAAPELVEELRSDEVPLPGPPDNERAKLDEAAEPDEAAAADVPAAATSSSASEVASDLPPQQELSDDELSDLATEFAERALQRVRERAALREAEANDSSAALKTDGSIGGSPRPSTAAAGAAALGIVPAEKPTADGSDEAEGGALARTPVTLPPALSGALRTADLLDPSTFTVAEQDDLLGAIGLGTALLFSLPLIEGSFVCAVFRRLTRWTALSARMLMAPTSPANDRSDLFFSLVVGGGLSAYAALRKDSVGTFTRSVAGQLPRAIPLHHDPSPPPILAWSKSGGHLAWHPSERTPHTIPRNQLATPSLPQARTSTSEHDLVPTPS